MTTDEKLERMQDKVRVYVNPAWNDHCSKYWEGSIRGPKNNFPHHLKIGKTKGQVILSIHYVVHLTI